MPRAITSKEDIDQIFKLKSENYSNVAIGKIFNISDSTVCRILNGYRKNTSKKQLCGKCGAELINDAKFCHMCGSKIKSKEDLLMEGLDYISSLTTTVIPPNDRDKVIQILLNLEEFIKGKTESEK